MKTYWDSFIFDYKNKIPSKDIALTLMAFWYYCNNEKGKAKEIMNK